MNDELQIRNYGFWSLQFSNRFSEKQIVVSVVRQFRGSFHDG
jgi:hypothetical protein